LLLLLLSSFCIIDPLLIRDLSLGLYCTSILILDWITSALDSESEIAVQKALDELLDRRRSRRQRLRSNPMVDVGGLLNDDANPNHHYHNDDEMMMSMTTTIIIAHRLRTVQNADQIM
jgi:hypothetical protein